MSRKIPKMSQTYLCIYMTVVAFDVGRMLPNTDLSQDFMGLVVDGLMDLGTYIWHPL